MEELIKRIREQLNPLREQCNDAFTERQIENIVIREACRQALLDIEIQGIANAKEGEDEN